MAYCTTVVTPLPTQWREVLQPGTEPSILYFHAVLPEYNLALHKPAWQSSMMAYPPAAVGVDGNIYTRIATRYGSHGFFAVDLERHFHVASVGLILMQQGS